MKLKNDSRTRFRFIESPEQSEESELEDNSDICVLLLNNVTYPVLKKSQKISFADFYTVMKDCRKEIEKKKKHEEAELKRIEKAKERSRNAQRGI